LSLRGEEGSREDIPLRAGIWKGVVWRVYLPLLYPSESRDIERRGLESTRTTFISLREQGYGKAWFGEYTSIPLRLMRP
jgi:hypothetical protein